MSALNIGSRGDTPAAQPLPAIVDNFDGLGRGKSKWKYNIENGGWNVLEKWKNRTDHPLNIKWCNSNVKSLGVYQGNNNPAEHTFLDIVTKVTKTKVGICLFNEMSIVLSPGSNFFSLKNP